MKTCLRELRSCLRCSWDTVEQKPENNSIKSAERRVSFYLHHPIQHCSAPRGITMAQDSVPHWEKEQPASSHTALLSTKGDHHGPRQCPSLGKGATSIPSLSCYCINDLFGFTPCTEQIWDLWGQQGPLKTGRFFQYHLCGGCYHAPSGLHWERLHRLFPLSKTTASTAAKDSLQLSLLKAPHALAFPHSGCLSPSPYPLTTLIRAYEVPQPQDPAGPPCLQPALASVAAYMHNVR